ncbi:response regulator transcription factor [Maricaulis sp.]|uniref:LuxR C-terminal-related transcriptional regulator n=1 Tax=unclassified Maricaulis TaxID=2632371 RepID=UPI001B28EC90|nr:response regulator transcription factor [Maricaulis sp.]MBO6796964.1 response regulator transcription factor [Maricaulis sp.]
MTRVLVVEDVKETRLWLSDIAGRAFSEPQITEAGSMRAGLAAVNSKDFDLALIDLGLPDGSGLEVLRNLKLVCSEAICIVTTVMGDDAHIVAALSAGADGYLLKDTPEDLFERQLKQLADGTPALSPSIARRIMEHFRFTGPAASPEDELSPREREVLGLIGRGLRNADVAKDLELAESTVASHIKSIYRKLGISSRAEAAWHAARMGLSTTP